MLRTELATTRKKLEHLLLEKENAEESVKKVQKVLENERMQLREVLKQAKMKIDSITARADTAERAHLAEKETTKAQAEDLRKKDLLITQLKEEIEILKRKLAACNGSVTDFTNEKSKLELKLKMTTQDMDAMRTRFEAELATERERYEILSKARDQSDCDRSSIQETLDRLRDTLKGQTRELEASAETIRQLTSERDRANGNCDLKVVEIDKLKGHNGNLSTQLSSTAAELGDAITEQERRQARINTLETELESLRQRSAAELSREQARYAALEDRLAKAADDRAELEAKLAELRKQLQLANEALESEKRNVNNLKNEMQGSASENKRSELRISQLQAENDELRNKIKALEDQLAACHQECKSLTTKLADAEQALVVQRDKNNKIRLRGAFHLMYEILERQHAIHYACSFYFWVQVASNAALERGAQDLADITDSAIADRSTLHEDHTPVYDDFNIEAMDIHAMAGQFGL